MKRCPECRRDYHDHSLLYCLDDGAQLVEGPGETAEAETALLSDLPGESPRRNLYIRPVSQKYWLIAGIAIVLTVAAYLGYRYFAPGRAEQIRSIAVLPFENSSGDSELDYLSDGVGESVIDRLSQLSQLKVIARNSSFQYRGQNLNLLEIANTLGVDAIVTGRVTRRGDSYLIRVDVTDVRENRQLWGENFNRKAPDVQILQADIAREIAENLRIRLSGAQTKQLASAGTTNPRAYELLLRGRFHFNKAGRDHFDKAVEYYEQAVAVDPNYALAFAELAEGYNYQGGRGLDIKQRVIKQAAAARRALELDPGLAEAHYAMAESERKQWHWLEAEREYLRAIELNPNLPQAYRGYAQYLSIMGQHEEAIAKARRAKDLDPLSLSINGSLGSSLYGARQYDEALEVWKKGAELAPESPVPNYWLGLVYQAKGMHAKALAEIQEAIRKRTAESPSVDALIGVIYADMGERTRAEEILKRVIAASREGEPPNAALNHERNLALLYDALGQRDAAFAELEKAYVQRNPTLPFIASSPAFDQLSSDPRFTDLLKRMGLPE